MVLQEAKRDQAVSIMFGSHEDKKTWEQNSGYSLVSVEFPSGQWSREPVYLEYDPRSLSEKLQVIGSEGLIKKGLDILEYLLSQPRIEPHCNFALGDLRNKGRLIHDLSWLEFYTLRGEERSDYYVSLVAYSQYHDERDLTSPRAIKLVGLRLKKSA